MIFKAIKKKLDLILPFWMILFYTFFLARLMIEISANEQCSTDIVRNSDMWFSWWFGCVLGIYAGIRYPQKQRIGIMAGLSLIGSPFILITFIAMSTRILYYFYRFNILKHINLFRQALETID